MPGAKSWTEKLNSQELQNLFGDFDVEIPDNPSRLSFAKGFLEASKLTEFVAEIRTFANRVVLWKRLKDKYKKPGTVYVHKVVVETIGNKIVIEEKDGREPDFFSEKNEDLVKVILIEGSLQNISETKKRVYQEYEEYFRKEKFILQHVSEQFVEIAKLSAHRKIVSFKHVIESIRDGIPLHSVEHIVNDAVNRSLSEEIITQLCNDAVIAESGNAQSYTYNCHSTATVRRLKGELETKTMTLVYDHLRSGLSAEIQKHIESKIKSKFDSSLIHSCFDLSSLEVVDPFFIEVVAWTVPFINPFAALAMFAELVETLSFPVNVNSPSWRGKVANDIYRQVSDKKQAVIKELTPAVQKRCEVTADHLTRVIRQLESCISRIHYIDQEARLFSKTTAVCL